MREMVTICPDTIRSESLPHFTPRDEQRCRESTFDCTDDNSTKIGAFRTESSSIVARLHLADYGRLDRTC